MSAFNMDVFVAAELGVDWQRTTDAAAGRVHTAVRRDLAADGFVCNAVVHEIEPGEPADLRATIPSAPVLLAASGIDRRGSTAELLFVDGPVTQWIGYRFEAVPPLQIVVSAATRDWPVVAPTVARLASGARPT